MAGLYFEDFKTGMVVEHAIRRTVTETDNAVLGHDLQLRAAAHRCRVQREQHLRPAPGQQHVPAGAGGRHYGVRDHAGTTLGTWAGEIAFPKPTFHGDTIRVETEILETRLSRSRQDSGIVTFKHVARNQRDEIVCTAVRTGLMMLRPAA